MRIEECTFYEEARHRGKTNRTLMVECKDDDCPLQAVWLDWHSDISHHDTGPGGGIPLLFACPICSGPTHLEWDP